MPKLKKAMNDDDMKPHVPASTLLDESMGYLIRKTFRTLSRALEMRLVEHDMTTSTWFFLRTLWERDGLTQKELSDELGLRQPTTVSAMDNLERRGLIRRVRNTEDRRKINICLTEKGKLLWNDLSKFVFEMNDVALQGFSRAEAVQLRDLLVRLNNSVNKDMAERMAAKGTAEHP